MPISKEFFTTEQALEVGFKLCIDFSAFDVEQFRMGMDVELEHGKVNKRTNITNDRAKMTGKIALAHLLEYPDYYTRLSLMEMEAKAFWKDKEK